MIYESERHIIGSLPAKESLDRQMTTVVVTSDGEFVGRDLAEDPVTERFAWHRYILVSMILGRLAIEIGDPTLLVASLASLIKGVSLFSIPKEGKRKTL